jgi:2-amino-4-hydroxy-6-hydroxymethyldihydropteridine diphosphokinase
MTGAADGGRRVVLALGSNLGDRLANIQRGLDALTAEPGLAGVAISGVYQTSPVGGPDQPDYLNAVMVAASDLPSCVILGRCLAAERAMGRIRPVHWGPRTLDVDVIACGDEVSDDPVLTLPHPRAHERAFVLAPWHEVDPQAHLPGAGPVADLLAVVGMNGVWRLAGVQLSVAQASVAQASVAQANVAQADAGNQE